jgi:hypothetical protein
VTLCSSLVAPGSGGAWVSACVLMRG